MSPRGSVERRLRLSIAAALLIGPFVFVLMIALPSGGSDDPGEPNSVLVVTGNDDTDDGDGRGDTDGDDVGPVGDGCAPLVDDDFMRANQVLTYYGSPDANILGIPGSSSRRRSWHG